MGGEASKGSDFETFLTNYTLQGKLLNQNLGVEAQIFAPNSSTPSESTLLAVLKNELSGEQSSEYERLKKLVEARKNLSHPNITNLERYGVSTAKMCCAEVVNLRFAFQISKQTLQEMIAERQSGKSLSVSGINPLRFDSPVLYDFFDQASKALQFFANNNKTCGYIKPAHIFIATLYGNRIFKFLDFSPCLPQDNMYQRMLVDRDYFAPLDPMLISQYEKKNRNVEFSLEQDLWALGITGLCLAYGRDFMHYYDFSKPEINYDRIKNDLRVLNEEGYEVNILKIISGLLNPNPIERMPLNIIQSKYLRRGSTDIRGSILRF